MTMKKSLIIFLPLLLFLSPILVQAVPLDLDRVVKKDFDRHVDAKLEGLYQKDDDKAEETLEALLDNPEQFFSKKDSYFLFRLLADFVLSRRVPQDLAQDSGYLGDLKDLQQKALKYLLDQAEESDRSVSEREYLSVLIGEIARSAKLPDFDFNEEAVNKLVDLVKSDSPVVSQASLMGLKSIILKEGDQWAESVNDALEAFSENLGSSEPERKRMALIAGLDILSGAKEKNPGIVKLWKGINASLPSFSSPGLQDDAQKRMNLLIKIKVRGPFSLLVNETIYAIKKMKSESEPVEMGFEEMLAELGGQDDISKLESMIKALREQTKDNPARSLRLVSRLEAAGLDPRVSGYKLRLLNEALIDMTRQSESPALFFQTAMGFLKQASFFNHNERGNLSLVMLLNLMTSTDQPGLLVPVIDELKGLLNSDLPFWVQNRLLLILFSQAGDSGSPQISLSATETIAAAAMGHKANILRREAYGKMIILSRFAYSDKTRIFAAKWL
ncbi:MAG: hypothetical protein OEY59_00870 [Deltaproteobacteria bacterium]|nr:hypothetical protein [Deltaproteobacteria bacterium]